MKTIFGMLFFVFISAEGFSQISLSPVVGVKKTFHRKIMHRDLSRPESIYSSYGIRAMIDLNDNVECYLGVDKANYTTPWDLDRVILGQFQPVDIDVHISSIRINAGVLINANRFYYKFGLGANYLRDFSIRYLDDTLLYFILWSGKENGNKANLYDGEIGLGYTFSNVFIELNYALALLVDAVEIDSFKGNSSVSLSAGYRFEIFDSKDRKKDCPDL